MDQKLISIAIACGDKLSGFEANSARCWLSKGWSVKEIAARILSERNA